MRSSNFAKFKDLWDLRAGRVSEASEASQTPRFCHREASHSFQPISLLAYLHCKELTSAPPRSSPDSGNLCVEQKSLAVALRGGEPGCRAVVA